MIRTENRPSPPLLRPVVLDSVVDDPESIRTLAREHGPYAQPGRQRVPPGLAWPSWRGHWAVRGEVLLKEAAPLLHNEAFLHAAKTVCGTDGTAPQSLYVNLSTPCGGQPVSHTDLSEFHGVDQTNAEAWLLQAMGGSGLFEPERQRVITAVSWFYRGERGYYRYWPNGRSQESVRQENMWNSAVVGDNDSMHHKVERIGAAGDTPPDRLTVDSTLEADGDEWVVLEGGLEIARYADDQVRLSLSWTAKVGLPSRTVKPLTLEDVYARFAATLGEEFAASGPEEIMSEGTRDQLMGMWPGFQRD